MTDPATFPQYYKLADQFIENIGNEDLAACARL